jgi:hypothetical protein
MISGMSSPSVPITAKTASGRQHRTGRQAGTSDGGRRGNREHQVLGVDPGQEEADPKRADGVEPVDRLHPLRHLRGLADWRSRPPLAEAGKGQE